MVMKVKLEKEKIKTCLTCPICNEIFDCATTISECLHTFCRKCIHEKIIEEDLDSCPVCNADLGCSPLEKLRSDHGLQDLRLKLFPENGENSMAETETSATSLSNSSTKEKSLTSPTLRSNLDTTKDSNPNHENDHSHTVSVSLDVEKSSEGMEDVCKIKISSGGFTDRRKSKNDMLIDEELCSKAENGLKIQSASKIPPNIAQNNRLDYEAVPSEGLMKKNEGFSFNLWKPLNCLAEAAEKTEFGRSNERENTSVFALHNARQNDARIEKFDRSSTRENGWNQMTVESVVPSNGQEDGKSVTGFESNTTENCIDKRKYNGNGNDSSPPLPLKPRKRRKLQGVWQKKNSVTEELSTSQEVTTMEVNNNKDERRNIPIWFSLIASKNQDTKAPLPQISSCYLRVKDVNLPISYIKKYLVKKLSLSSEAEVEISLRGEPLLSSQRLNSLVEWWIKTAPVSERISPSVGESAKDFVMVLSYSRKSLL